MQKDLLQREIELVNKEIEQVQRERENAASDPSNKNYYNLVDKEQMLQRKLASLNSSLANIDR